MLKLATFLLLGLLSVCGQLISSQENLTITAPIDTSRNSFLILTNEENLFSLTKNSSLASTSNATSNSTSNETSSSSSLGNAYRVDAFFQELFGPSGFVEVEIVDWFSVNASNVILKKVYKLRLRSIIEFEDTGAAGFDSETPLQVFKLNSSWTFWRGPNKLSNGVWTWDATSNNSAFGLLGVANTSSQIPFTTSFPRNGVNVSALTEGPIRVLNVSSGSVFDFDFSSVSSSGNETSGNATSGSNATSTSGSLNADMTSALNSLNNFPKTGTENVLTVPAIFWVNDLNVSNLFTSNSSRLALQMQLSYFEFVIVNSSSGSVFEISIPANVSAKSILDRFGDLPATILGSNGSVPLIISNFTSIHLPSNARPARNDTSYIFYATINSTSHAGIYHNFTMLRGYNLAELTGASNASSNTSGSRQPILINDDAPSDLEAQFETAAPISDISSEFNRLPMEAFINLPSGGSLIANFTVFLDNSTVCWVVTWSDLPEFTSIGVYGPAEPSVFGPLIFEITNSSVSQNATSGNSTSSPSSGGASPSGTARDCKTLTFAQLNGIVDGLWYVLIKTPQAPAQPELFRGQILPAEASKSS